MAFAENVNPGDVASKAVEGAAVGAIAVGAWTLLKTFAFGAAAFIEGMVPVLIPGAVVGAAAFGLLRLVNNLFPPAKK